MPKRKKGTHSGLCWLWVTLGVFVLDRLAKHLALSDLSLDGGPLPLLPHLNLSLAFNRGAAFSFLGGASGWQIWFLSLMALAASGIILYILARTPASRRGFSVALALILGGALGNFYDRIVYFSVIDFIDVYAGRWHWPVFNLADSAICLGALWVILDGFAGRHRK